MGSQLNIKSDDAHALASRLSELTGESLTISQAATTMMACPQPVMEQEALFLAVLTGTTRCTITADGTLTLHAGDGRTLTARRMP